MARPYQDEEVRDSYPGKLLDETGKRLCVNHGCHKLLVGRQERWCSQSCVNEALATYMWSVARKKALRRDKFKCVKCGAMADEVDHIVPLIEGGKLCDQANLRTLCRQHHKEETAALAKRMAERRRMAKAEAALATAYWNRN